MDFITTYEQVMKATRQKTIYYAAVSVLARNYDCKQLGYGRKMNGELTKHDDKVVLYCLNWNYSKVRPLNSFSF